MKVVFDLEKPEKEGFIQPGTIYIYNDIWNDCIRRIFVRSLVETFEKVNNEIVDIDNGELLKGFIDKENIFIGKGKIKSLSPEIWLSPAEDAPHFKF